MTDINELLDMDYAPSWIPNEFDKLIGEVVDIDERDGGYGVYPIITVKVTDTPTPVRLKDGEAKAGDLVAWHAMSTIAKDEAKDVQRGQMIGVKRQADKVSTKTNKTMTVWRVKTTGGSRPVAASAPVDEVSVDPDELI